MRHSDTIVPELPRPTRRAAPPETARPTTSGKQRLFCARDGLQRDPEIVPSGATSGMSSSTASSSMSQMSGWNPQRFIETSASPESCFGSRPSSAMNDAVRLPRHPASLGEPDQMVRFSSVRQTPRVTGSSVRTVSARLKATSAFAPYARQSGKEPESAPPRRRRPSSRPRRARRRRRTWRRGPRGRSRAGRVGLRSTSRPTAARCARRGTSIAGVVFGPSTSTTRPNPGGECVRGRQVDDRLTVDAERCERLASAVPLRHARGEHDQARTRSPGSATPAQDGARPGHAPSESGEQDDVTRSQAARSRARRPVRGGSMPKRCCRSGRS